jgi:hypothetical protein
VSRDLTRNRETSMPRYDATQAALAYGIVSAACGGSS